MTDALVQSCAGVRHFFTQAVLGLREYDRRPVDGENMLAPCVVAYAFCSAGFCRAGDLS